MTSSGGTPSRSRLSYYTGKIPWVTTSELRDRDIFDTNEHITQQAVDNSSAKMFDAGTLLLAMYGATIGRLGVLKVAATTNQACCAITPKEKLASTSYLFYALYYLRDELINLGSGAGQPNISQEIVNNFELEVPEKMEQIRIADILTDIDDDITTHEKLISKKRQVKTGVMQQLLTGKTRLLEAA